MHSFRLRRILTIALFCVAPIVSAQPPEQHSVQESTQTISVVLGPVDARHLLEESARIVTSTPSTITLTNRAQVLDNLHRAGSYMKVLSDESRARNPWSWTYLGRKRVAAGAFDFDSYLALVGLSQVSALRFKSLIRDIQVIEVALLDISGKSTTIPYNKWISSSLPKREILYLDAPMDLQRVILKMHRTAGRSPRMILDAGVSSKPDFAYQTWAACEKSILALERSDITTMLQHLAQALVAVKKAEEQLAD